MPFSTTTSISVGSVLDAIPAPTGPPADDQHQTAFNALLSPPAPSVCPPPQADDRLPDSTTRLADSQHDDNSSSPRPANASSAPRDAAVEDSPHQEHKEDSASATPPQSAPKTADEPAAKDKSPHDDENVAADSAAASLAAAAAAILPVVAEKPIAVAKAQAAVAGEATALPAAQQAAIDANSGQPAVLQAAAEQAAANQSAVLATAQAAAGAAKLDKSGNSAAANKNESNAATASAQTGERAVQAAASQVDAKSEQAAADDKNSIGETSAGSRDKSDPHKEPDSITPGVESLNAAMPASDAAAAANDKTGSPPVAQPPAPGVANSGPTSSPTSAASVQPPAPPIIARLPGEALAQGAKATTRRPVSEAETARLLGRVARAFTAAQQGDGEIRLRLSPPELGALRLQVQVNDGALVARLETETSAARTALIDNLPALRERLAEQGVRIERFDVDLMQRQPGGMPDQSGGRQQDPLTDPFRSAPPARPRPQSAVSTISPSVSAGAADGLNVIV